MRHYQTLHTSNFRLSLSLFSEFGRLKFTQKMKDDLAYLMTVQDWKDICKKFLPDEEDRVICEHKKTYDQAYDVVCLLIERGKVSTWSDMENLLNQVNKTIAKRFKKKCKTSQLAAG